MTASVLVPLDGSDRDERALSAAAALADLVGGGLHLVRVLDTPIDSLSPRARTMGVADAAREMRRAMERSVHAAAERLARDAGRAATTEVAESFDVAGLLVRRAHAHDLVVMATRASGALGRALRGSVADRVMRESPCPVVLVPPRADDIATRRLELHRVLLPLDRSVLALGAVEWLLALPRGPALSFVLLEAVTPDAASDLAANVAALPLYGGLADAAHARAEAERRLSAVAGRLRASGVRDVAMRVVTAASAAAEIVRAAREEHADLVAMSTRGMSGLKRFMLGSVTEQVVRSSDVPVLLVAPRAAAPPPT